MLKKFRQTTPSSVSTPLEHYEYRTIKLGTDCDLAAVCNHWSSAGWEPVFMIPAEVYKWDDADGMLIRRVLPEGERA